MSVLVTVDRQQGVQVTLTATKHVEELAAILEEALGVTPPADAYTWTASNKTAMTTLRWLLSFMVGKEDPPAPLVPLDQAPAIPKTTRPPKPPKEPAETTLRDRPEVQQAIALYREGKSAAEVGVLLGYKRTTVARWLRVLQEVRPKREAVLAGQSKRRDRIDNRPEVQEACRLYQEGHSAAAIGVMLGKQEWTICYWLRTLGLTRKRGRARPQ